MIFEYGEDNIDSFYIKGGVMIEINPLEYDCYNCFNPRLDFVEMDFSTDKSLRSDSLSFEIVHMGAELFPIMENGVRQITFVQNSPQVRLLSSIQFTDDTKLILGNKMQKVSSH